eukprot:scaffold12935_cov78-Attheya_sp.AAC.1
MSGSEHVKMCFVVSSTTLQHGHRSLSHIFIASIICPVVQNCVTCFNAQSWYICGIHGLKDVPIDDDARLFSFIDGARLKLGHILGSVEGIRLMLGPIIDSEAGSTEDLYWRRASSFAAVSSLAPSLTSLTASMFRVASQTIPEIKLLGARGS